MKTLNLQDSYLNLLRRDAVPLTIFLMNGFQLKGRIRSFDNFVLLVEADGRQQMVYKHAVSTVSPCLPVDLSALFSPLPEE